jgi:hypothetical protein
MTTGFPIACILLDCATADVMTPEVIVPTPRAAVFRRNSLREVDMVWLSQKKEE